MGWCWYVDICRASGCDVAWGSSSRQLSLWSYIPSPLSRHANTSSFSCWWLHACIIACMLMIRSHCPLTQNICSYVLLYDGQGVMITDVSLTLPHCRRRGICYYCIALHGWSWPYIPVPQHICTYVVGWTWPYIPVPHMHIHVCMIWDHMCDRWIPSWMVITHAVLVTHDGCYGMMLICRHMSCQWMRCCMVMEQQLSLFSYIPSPLSRHANTSSFSCWWLHACIIACMLMIRSHCPLSPNICSYVLL